MYQFFAILVFPVLISCSVKLSPASKKFALAPVHEIFQSVRYGVLEHLVAEPKVNTKKKGRQNHHYRGSVDFLFARPGYPPGLGLYLVGILLEPLPEPFGLLQCATAVIFPNTDVFSHFTLDPVERFAARQRKSPHPKSGRGGGI